MLLKFRGTNPPRKCSELLGFRKSGDFMVGLFENSVRHLETFCIVNKGIYSFYFQCFAETMQY